MAQRNTEERTLNAGRSCPGGFRALKGKLDATGQTVRIVVARFNAFITERLLQSACDGLLRSGAARKDIDIVRVPGAFEIPSAARTLAETENMTRSFVLAACCAGIRRIMT